MSHPNLNYPLIIHNVVKKKFELSLRSLACPPGNLFTCKAEKTTLGCHLLKPMVFELERNHILWKILTEEIIQDVFVQCGHLELTLDVVALDNPQTASHNNTFQ